MNKILIFMLILFDLAVLGLMVEQHPDRISGDDIVQLSIERPASAPILQTSGSGTAYTIVNTSCGTVTSASGAICTTTIPILTTSTAQR